MNELRKKFRGGPERQLWKIYPVECFYSRIPQVSNKSCLMMPYVHCVHVVTFEIVSVASPTSLKRYLVSKSVSRNEIYLFLLYICNVIDKFYILQYVFKILSLVSWNMKTLTTNVVFNSLSLTWSLEKGFVMIA